MSVIRCAPMRVTTFRFHAAGGWVRHEDYAELEQQLTEFKQTARRLVTDTHNKWAIDRLIILAGEGNE